MWLVFRCKELCCKSSTWLRFRHSSKLREGATTATNFAIFDRELCKSYCTVHDVIPCILFADLLYHHIPFSGLYLIIESLTSFAHMVPREYCKLNCKRKVPTTWSDSPWSGCKPVWQAKVPKYDQCSWYNKDRLTSSFKMKRWIDVLVIENKIGE